MYLCEIFFDQVLCLCLIFCRKVSGENLPALLPTLPDNMALHPLLSLSVCCPPPLSFSASLIPFLYRLWSSRFSALHYKYMANVFHESFFDIYPKTITKYPFIRAGRNIYGITFSKKVNYSRLPKVLPIFFVFATPYYI